MNDDARIIQFPVEWNVAQGFLPGYPTRLMSKDDGTAVVAGGVLLDGSNVLGLWWPNGQRVLRISPDTGWALEERFDGDAPADLAQVWRTLVECAIAGAQVARAEEA